MFLIYKYVLGFSDFYSDTEFILWIITAQPDVPIVVTIINTFTGTFNKSDSDNYV